ncbi:MAG: ATP-binding protein [Proteobacteria bacterium]|jgi:hypothetical protein|nr:ATP-binding protein [Pseudomonadota bacterium]
MSVESQRILNDILEKKGSTINLGAIMTKMPRNSQNPYAIMDEEEEKFGRMTQWTTSDGTRFFPAGKTFPLLCPGVYEIKFSNTKGYYFEKVQVKTEGLLRFPDSESAKVVAEIQNFWTKEQTYADFGLTYRRGLILWGPAGSGKSCTIQIVMADVIERGGVVFKFNSVPHMFLEGVRLFREVQPDTKIVVLMEDIDSLLEEYGESEVLNILDGVEKIERVVFLATTNYPEKLGDRIINRPSRFDRRFMMPNPNKKCRQLYFEHLAKQNPTIKIDIAKWTKDTSGFSIAHLKELFIGVCILGEEYKDAVETLRIMIEERPKSDESDGFGFIPKKNED